MKVIDLNRKQMKMERKETSMQVIDLKRKTTEKENLNASD